jgi:proline iminopeptidase
LFQATTAYALKKAFPEITLHIVPDAGHSSREPGTAKLLIEVGLFFVCILALFR